MFSAICDLFIILGSQGLPLRQRVLISCKKILDKKQMETLNYYLVDKVLNSEMLFLSDNCFFKKKSLKVLQLDNLPMKNKTEYKDVLHTADSYIENSQFETALEYMIIQLEQDNKNRKLTIKLIELYKSLDYADEFDNAYYKLVGDLATSELWHDAKEYFKNNSQKA